MYLFKAIEDGNLEELEQKKKKKKLEVGNQKEVETKERSESPIPSVCYICSTLYMLLRFKCN